MEPSTPTPTNTEHLQVQPIPLGKRKLTEATLAKWGAGETDFKGKNWLAFTYRNEDGTVAGYKLRDPRKQMLVVGGSFSNILYGRHLWGDSGKRVIVTEGELDALSVSQVLDHRWPVVSVPNGAQAAPKSIAANVEWLSGFDEVVFMFDMDDAGRTAAKACAEILPPGKAKLAELPMKDASDMVMAGRTKELVDAQWKARTFRPDGIIQGDEVWEAMVAEDTTTSIPYPWTGWNEKTFGMRTGELVTIVAGTGVGKSACMREIAYYLTQLEEPIGYIALEESVRTTALGLAGLHLNRPIRVLGAQAVSPEDLRDAYDQAVKPVYMYDHWGSLDSEALLAKVRYLARACGCRWIFFDHLSILVSGQDNADERRGIDLTMTKLRSLVEETGIGLFLVSHLKRRDGLAHEQGGEVSLSDLRGSQAIAQLSDMVIGLERNQQDEENPDLSTVRVLKNRFSGDTGITAHLSYNKETGRLREAHPEFSDLPIDDLAVDF